MIANLNPAHIYAIADVQSQAKTIAKEKGVKIRRNPRSGIDVKYPNGEKAHYFGWILLKQDLEKRY